MVRRVARSILRPIRRFNRWWIDRLDPDVSERVPVSPPDARQPVATSAGPAKAPEPTRVRERVASMTMWAEATPNPDAVKFNCSISVTDAPVTWRAGDRTGDPVGQALLAIPGVRSAFAVGDFVTITRSPNADWDVLTPAIEDALRSALTE